MNRLECLARDPYAKPGVIHMSQSTLQYWVHTVDRLARNERKLDGFLGVVWRAGEDEESTWYSYKTQTEDNCFPVVENPLIPTGYFKVHHYDGPTVLHQL